MSCRKLEEVILFLNVDKANLDMIQNSNRIQQQQT